MNFDVKGRYASVSISFRVKNSPIQATLLQWDHTGSKLMVGMEDGTVQVFGMGSNLLNKWNVLYEAVFSGEPIMNAAWLSHPRRLVVDTDKLDGVLYSEKYSVSIPYSSKGFGGKGLEGLVLVTGTGLLGSIVASSMEDGKPIVCSEKMVAVRGHVQFADTAYCSGNYSTTKLFSLVKHFCNEPLLVTRWRCHGGHQHGRFKATYPC